MNTESNGSFFHDRRSEGRRHTPTWTAQTEPLEATRWSYGTSVKPKEEWGDPEHSFYDWDPARHEALEGGTPSEGWTPRYS